MPVSKTAAAKAKTGGDAGQDEAKEEWAKMIIAAGEKAPPALAPHIAKAAPVIATVIVLLQTAWPHIVKYSTMAGQVYEKLPKAALKVILGLLMCFFGGVFPSTIAAFEAFKLCGGHDAIGHVKALFDQMTNLKDALAEDDAKDNDGDGVADAKQLDGKQLIARKVSVAAKTIDPVQINSHLACFYVAWAGVIASLKLQFARTVTLSCAISETLYEGAEQFILPRAKVVVPEEYEKWIPVVAQWICKFVAVSVAWWIQSIISAVHSGIRGGFMVSRNAMKLANQYGYLNVDHKKTNIDEMAGYVLAFFGLIFQLRSGFDLPLLLKLFFWPLQIVEYSIQWQVSY